jgi:hypothetical protein
VMINSLLIRSSMCRHPDPFRSVRDLGRVPVGCPWKSGESRCRSSVWLPAWLPAVLDAWPAAPGIEPALSAWESVPVKAAMRPDLRGGLSVSVRDRPLVTGVNGTLMARRPSVEPC